DGAPLAGFAIERSAARPRLRDEGPERRRSRGLDRAVRTSEPDDRARYPVGDLDDAHLVAGVRRGGRGALEHDGVAESGADEAAHRLEAGRHVCDARLETKPVEDRARVVPRRGDVEQYERFVGEL